MRKRLSMLLISLILILALASTALAEGNTHYIRNDFSTSDGGGVAGRTYGKDTIMRDLTGGNCHGGLVGYRIYLVDKDKKAQTEAKDIIGVRNIVYGNGLPKNDMVYLGSTCFGASVDTDYIEVAFTTDTTADVNDTDDGKNLVYRAAYYGKDGKDGTFVYGDNFKEWIMNKGSDGYTNAAKLLLLAYDNDLDKVNGYLEHEDWSLVVEPIIKMNLWTDIVAVPIKQTHTVQYTKEHLIVLQPGAGYGEGTAYDMCYNSCSKTAGGCITGEDIDGYCKSKGLPDNGEIYYTITAPTEELKNMLYDSYIKPRENEQRTVIEGLGYKYGTLYENLSPNEDKIKVYNTLNDKNMLVPGQLYVTGETEDGFEYNPAHHVFFEEDNSQLFYADRSAVPMPDGIGYYKGYEPYTKDGVTYHYVDALASGKIYVDTYKGIKNKLKTLKNLDGTACTGTGGECEDYLKALGKGFKLEKGALGLPADEYGIHVYGLKDIQQKKPIHTYWEKSPDYCEPPTEEKKNTGGITIVKVYGNRFKDGTTTYAITDYSTYSRSGCSEQVVIQDEDVFKLQKWIVTSQEAPSTSYKATDWLKQNGVDDFDYWSSHVDNGSSTTTDEAPYRVPSTGKTMYLLYLRDMEYIETKDDEDPIPTEKVILDPTPETPPYDVEEPEGLKGGDYNIVKLYTILDDYNGKPLSSQVVYKKSTTPFIKIENESGWKLASWKTATNTKTDINGTQFFKEASNEAELEKFYEQGYLEKDFSGVGLGSIKTKSNVAGTYYFDDGSKCLYIFFVATNSDVKYTSGKRVVSESYLVRRLQTSGYYKMKSNGVQSFVEDDLLITATLPDGSTYTENLRDHDFVVTNGSVGGNTWSDSEITLTLSSGSGGLGVVQSKTLLYTRDIVEKLREPEYKHTKNRNDFGIESISFQDLDNMAICYRAGDKVNFRNWGLVNAEGNAIRYTEDKYVKHNLIADSAVFFKNSFTGLSGGVPNKASTGIAQTDFNHNMVLGVIFHETDCDLYTESNAGNTTGTFEGAREFAFTVPVTYEVFKADDNATLNTNMEKAGVSLKGLADLSTDSSNKVTMGRRATIGKVKLTPYVQMQYDSSTILGSEVLVMGQYEREIQVNEYAGVYYEYSDNDRKVNGNELDTEKGKISLSSVQWSTYSAAMNVSQAKSILPVGATLNLRITDSNKQTVYCESYIPVLLGSGMDQVTATGGSNTGVTSTFENLKLRLSSHESFANSVKSNLEKVNIEQYISKEYSASDAKEEVKDGKLPNPVYKGGSLVEIPEDAESKYYFRPSDDSSDSGIATDATNAADLDANLNPTKYEFITVFSDVEGNIRVKKSSYTGSYTDAAFQNKLEANAKIIDGTAEESEIVVKAGSNEIVKYKDFDNKTGAISHMIYGLQRNGGDDEFAYWATKSAEGEYQWYHEAFDGVTFVHCESPIEVKFMPSDS